MAIATQKTAAETAYVEGFDAGGDWLSGERRKGFDAFAVTGLPHRRMEDWKWTDLRQLIGKAYPPAKGGAVGDVDALVARSPLKDIARGRLTFVNGEYDEARPLYERALEIWTRVSGEGSPQVANVLSNLGLLAWTMGDYTEAAQLQTRVPHPKG